MAFVRSVKVTNGPRKTLGETASAPKDGPRDANENQERLGGTEFPSSQFPAHYEPR
ncbi:hypothetical protein DAPPUDRAFT_239036 [Daphnia pulex]|uniref:Uncharacterized protein n=1 Tax=Daphnia pulex TaxID=6669 RepID=E9G859_DAPPU|nr:hypothetical protein DAPPUDRAFT_239036 [Daphnia pulex]|eukprot:EFX83920.1 hypothetical protein DAPPUDRAFT_239036 [Daphnia pulex]